MTIICQSALSANPSTTTVPGTTSLEFDAIASPATAMAQVHYELDDKTSCVVFANGTKFDAMQQSVSAFATTTLSYHANFVCGAGGTQPPSVDVTVRVFQSGAPQCAPLVVNIPISQYNCPPTARRANVRDEATPKTTAVRRTAKKKVRKGK